MLPDKLILIEQINSVIKRNSCNQSLKHNDCAIAERGVKNGDELNGQIQYFFSEKSEQLRRLEQRIQTLEEQDDHLLYFIHFLFDNFGELVKEIVSSCQEARNENQLNRQEVKKQLSITETVEKESPLITRRDMDVLNLLVKGLCAKEIANALFISETTVITHKKHLKEKFNARNSAELISKALNV